MKTLTKLFYKELLNTFIITYFVFFTITLSFDFIDKFDDILKSKINTLDSFLFFFYRAVYLYSEYSNYALLIAVVIGLNIMSQRNELVSLFTSAISLRKIFITVTSFVIFLGLLNLIFTAYLSPKFLLEAEKKINKKISSIEEIDDLIFKTNNGFIFIDLIIPAENILINTYVVNIGRDRKIDNIIYAKRVEKIGNEWSGKDIKSYEINKKIISPLESIDLPDLNNLEGLSTISYKPEWLTLFDIQKVITSGLKSGINVKNYIYSLTKKIFSFFSLILLLILTFPLGIQLGRMKKNVEVVFFSIIILTSYSILETIIFRFSRTLNLFFAIPPLFLSLSIIFLSYIIWKKHFFWKNNKKVLLREKHQRQ